MQRTGSERIGLFLKRRQAISHLRIGIAKHFVANVERLNYARSGKGDDLEDLRTALDPGFLELTDKIRRLGVSQKTVAQVVRDTVFQGNVDPNQVSFMADTFASAYLDKLREYKKSLQASQSIKSKLGPRSDLVTR